MIAKMELAAAKAQHQEALVLTKACHNENKELRFKIEALARREISKMKDEEIKAVSGKKPTPQPQGTALYKYEVTGTKREDPVWDSNVRHICRDTLEPIIYEKTEGSLEKFGDCSIYVLREFLKECKRLDVNFMDVSEKFFFVELFVVEE